MNLIIEDANINMLHFIPIATLPLIVETNIKNMMTNFMAILVAASIVYLFNMILDNIGNRVDNTFSKLKQEIKIRDEQIEELTQLIKTKFATDIKETKENKENP